MIDKYLDRFRELKLKLENCDDELVKESIVNEMKKVALYVPYLKGWPSAKVFWNEEAAIWRNRVSKEYRSLIDKIVGSYCSSNNLDLGSGCFGFGVSLDISFEMMKYSKSKFRVVSDLENELPFKSSSFDSVSLIFVLNYITNVDSLLSEVRRVLKPNGRILVIQALNPFKSVHYLVEKNSLDSLVSKLGKYKKVKNLAVFKA